MHGPTSPELISKLTLGELSHLVKVTQLTSSGRMQTWHVLVERLVLHFKDAEGHC